MLNLIYLAGKNPPGKRQIPLLSSAASYDSGARGARPLAPGCRFSDSLCMLLIADGILFIKGIRIFCGHLPKQQIGEIVRRQARIIIRFSTSPLGTYP